MKKSGGLKPNRATSSSSLTQPMENVASTSGRKASTPIQDRTAPSVSPDISHVFPVGSNTSGIERQVEEPAKKNAFKKPLAKNEDMAKELEFEYTRYLQTAFKKKLMEKQSREIDGKMDNLQKQIADNQRMLQLTTERLKNIQFNKEVELLHSLHNPDYGRILETHNSTNYEQQLLNMKEKLELTQNQLKVKNIEVPEGGAGQLLEILTDTSAAFENLKKKNNVDTCKTLTEANVLRKEIDTIVSRCNENLQVAKDTASTAAMLKISQPDE